MSARLVADQVCSGYPGRAVVRNVSFEVQPGELWAILGPNGAGKSTLVKTLLGLLPKSAGRVEVLGRALESWPRRALAQQVAWVPQEARAEVDFPVMDVALMGRAPHQPGMGFASKADVAQAHGVLAELGLSELEHRKLDTLSGGERRLVLLARALMQTPALIFLDEPTAFLDMRHQVEVLTRLRSRVRAGLAVVAVLHDVNLASGFADHVLMLKEGQVLGAGPAEDGLRRETLETLFGLPLSEARTDAGQRLFAPRLHP